MRTCTECGQTKPLAEFTPIRGTPYVHGRCKACRARRRWELENPGLRYDGRDYRSKAWHAGRVRSARADKREVLSPGMRRCLDCGEVKTTDAFTPIKGKQACYGHCRACRNKRAMERYWSDPNEREKLIQRSRRYRERHRTARN